MTLYDTHPMPCRTMPNCYSMSWLSIRAFERNSETTFNNIYMQPLQQIVGSRTIMPERDLGCHSSPIMHAPRAPSLSQVRGRLALGRGAAARIARLLLAASAPAEARRASRCRRGALLFSWMPSDRRRGARLALEGTGAVGGLPVARRACRGAAAA